MVTVPPIRSNGVNHDLGSGNNGLDRLVVPNIYNENSNITAKLEFSLELFQLLL